MKISARLREWHISGVAVPRYEVDVVTSSASEAAAVIRKIQAAPRVGQVFRSGLMVSVEVTSREARSTDQAIGFVTRLLQGPLESQISRKVETMDDGGSSVPFTVCSPNDPVTPSQLQILERYLDAIWGKVGIDIHFTRHFFDRVNDARNGKQITVCELQQLFTSAFRRHGAAIVSAGSKKREVDGLLKSIGTQINSPFVMQWNERNGEYELVLATVMRKKNFMVPGGQKQFKVEGATMGPFESVIERRAGALAVSESLLSPADAKKFGYTAILVPTKSKYPSFGPRGYKSSDEADQDGKTNFPKGYSVYTPEGYKQAWLDGVIEGAAPAGANLTETDDPWEAAANIINQNDPIASAKRALAELDHAFTQAKRDLAGHKRAGVGITETPSILRTTIVPKLNWAINVLSGYDQHIQEILADTHGAGLR